MSSSQSTTTAAAARSIIYLGMDVHKESITIAVLPATAKTATRIERLPNDLAKLKRVVDRLARDGELRICYEASGAGYVLHRALTEWGYSCDVIAPSLIPKRPGVQRKHDKRDASDLARLYRAEELTPVRIPSEAEERVRDVVRCRETFPARDPQVAALHPQVPRAARLRLSRRHELVHAAPEVAAAADDGAVAARASGPVGLPGVSRVARIQAAAAG